MQPTKGRYSLKWYPRTKMGRIGKPKKSRVKFFKKKTAVNSKSTEKTAAAEQGMLIDAFSIFILTRRFELIAT